MIKGRGRITDGDTPVLILGLSRENCMRLLDDQPIHVTSRQLAEIGLPNNLEVLLCAGETEEGIVATLGFSPDGNDGVGQRFKKARP